LSLTRALVCKSPTSRHPAERAKLQGQAASPRSKGRPREGGWEGGGREASLPHPEIMAGRDVGGGM
jgi:hypothetical protein